MRIKERETRLTLQEHDDDDDVSVALLRPSPQLYSAGPHRPQYLFVQHQFIVYRQGPQLEDLVRKLVQ